MDEKNKKQDSAKDKKLNNIRVDGNIDIEIFFKEFCDSRIKIEEELKMLKLKLNQRPKEISSDVISEIPLTSDNYNNDNYQLNNNINYINNEENLFNINKELQRNLENEGQVNSTLTYLKDSVQFLMKSFKTTINKDDLEKIQKINIEEIKNLVNKIINFKVCNFIWRIDKKRRKNQKIIRFHITAIYRQSWNCKKKIKHKKSIVQKIGRETLKEDISNAVTETLQKLEALKIFNHKIESNSDNINKLFENVEDLQKNNGDDKGNESSENNNFILIKELKAKTQDLESYFRYLKNLFDENMKSLEDIDGTSKESKDQSTSLRDYIRHLAGTLKGIDEKVNIFIFIFFRTIN